MKEEEEEEEAELLEELADLEHRQWWAWSQNVTTKNDLRIETIERWKKLWVPYSDLSEEMKEEDRKWARRVLELIKTNHIILSKHDLTDEERQTAKDASNIFR